jgi:cytochrome c oxidase cbb3-type subunit 3
MAEKYNPEEVRDTGQVWDGVRELTNPAPRWWMICFHISWIWIIVYILLYPAIPFVNGKSSKGLLGWTAIKEMKQAVAENEAVKAPYLKKISAMSAKQIIDDPEMRNFAESAAKAVFGDNCAACHGSGGQGAPGLFPVLADDDWLYGGDLDTIIETITDGRMGNMPAHAGEVSDADINTLADFVISLSNGSKGSKAEWALFDESGCTGCHGSDARGSLNEEVAGSGGANLTDKIWRFSGERDEVLRTIRNGVNQEDVPGTRTPRMPAFGEKLTADQIKILAVKVHGLGGGK